MPFDPKRPHGRVFGDLGRAAFEQAGKLYDAQHNELSADGKTIVVKAPSAAPVAEAPSGPAKLPPAGARKAASKAKGKKAAEVAPQGEAPPAAPKTGLVSPSKDQLQEWAAGRTNLIFADVKKMVLERYGKEPISKVEAREIIQGAG